MLQGTLDGWLCAPLPHVAFSELPSPDSFSPTSDAPDLVFPTSDAPAPDPLAAVRGGSGI